MVVAMSALALPKLQGSSQRKDPVPRYFKKMEVDKV